MRPPRFLAVMTIPIALLAASCGKDSKSSDSATTEAPAVTEAPETTEAPAVSMSRGLLK